SYQPPHAPAARRRIHPPTPSLVLSVIRRGDRRGPQITRCAAWRGRSTRRGLSARPFLLLTDPLSQPAQLLVDPRVKAEHAVGDLGDFLGFFPLTLQLLDLATLVDCHLQGEAPLVREAPQRELAPGHSVSQLLR